MTTVVQVELRAGETHRTCWLDTSKRFKAGDEVTLKNSEDPDQRWTVHSIGAPKDSSDVRSDWNVGGVTSRR